MFFFNLGTVDSDRGLSSLPTDLGDFKQVGDLASFLLSQSIEEMFLFNKDKLDIGTKQLSKEADRLS